MRTQGNLPIIGETKRHVNQNTADQASSVKVKSDQKIGNPILHSQINGISIMDIPGVHK